MDVGAIAPGAIVDTQVAPAVEAQVLGAVIERPAVTPETGQIPSTSSVLGGTVTRSAALARTGLGIGSLMVMAGVLLLVGSAMVRRPRRTHFLA